MWKVTGQENGKAGRVAAICLTWGQKVYKRIRWFADLIQCACAMSKTNNQF
jgi:hypothetical protein